MSVGLSKPHDPRKLPEHVLWTLTKGDRAAGARTRMTPLGPELRFLIWRGDKPPGDEDLLWSQVFKPDDGGGAALGERAEQKRREFLALGWTANNDASGQKSRPPSRLRLGASGHERLP